MHQGVYSHDEIIACLEDLKHAGSCAAEGFMKPEGIVIFHSASRELYKVTIEKDEAPKSKAA